MGCHPKPIDELIFFKMVKTTNKLRITYIYIYIHIYIYIQIELTFLCYFRIMESLTNENAKCCCPGSGSRSRGRKVGLLRLVFAMGF